MTTKIHTACVDGEATVVIDVPKVTTELKNGIFSNSSGIQPNVDARGTTDQRHASIELNAQDSLTQERNETNKKSFTGEDPFIIGTLLSSRHDSRLSVTETRTSVSKYCNESAVTDDLSSWFSASSLQDTERSVEDKHVEKCPIATTSSIIKIPPENGVPAGQYQKCLTTEEKLDGRELRNRSVRKRICLEEANAYWECTSMGGDATKESQHKTKLVSGNEQAEKACCNIKDSDMCSESPSLLLKDSKIYEEKNDVTAYGEPQEESFSIKTQSSQINSFPLRNNTATANLNCEDENQDEEEEGEIEEDEPVNKSNHCHSDDNTIRLNNGMCTAYADFQSMHTRQCRQMGMIENRRPSSTYLPRDVGGLIQSLSMDPYSTRLTINPHLSFQRCLTSIPQSKKPTEHEFGRKDEKDRSSSCGPTGRTNSRDEQLTTVQEKASGNSCSSSLSSEAMINPECFILHSEYNDDLSCSSKSDTETVRTFQRSNLTNCSENNRMFEGSWISSDGRFGPPSSFEYLPHGFIHRVVLSILKSSVDVAAFIRYIEGEVPNHLGIQCIRGASGRRALRLDFTSHSDMLRGLRCCDVYPTLIDDVDNSIPSWKVLSIVRIPRHTFTYPIKHAPHSLVNQALSDRGSSSIVNEPKSPHHKFVGMDRSPRQRGLSSFSPQSSLIPQTIAQNQNAIAAQPSSNESLTDILRNMTNLTSTVSPNPSSSSLLISQSTSKIDPSKIYSSARSNFNVENTMSTSSTPSMSDPSSRPLSPDDLHDGASSSDNPTTYHRNEIPHDAFDSTKTVCPSMNSFGATHGCRATPFSTGAIVNNFDSCDISPYKSCSSITGYREYSLSNENFYFYDHVNEYPPQLLPYTSYSHGANYDYSRGTTQLNQHGGQLQLPYWQHPSTPLSSYSLYATMPPPPPQNHQYMRRLSPRLDAPLEIRKLKPVSYWCEHMTLEQQAEDYRRLVSRFGFTNRYALLRNLPVKLRTTNAVSKFVLEMSGTTEDFEIDIIDYDGDSSNFVAHISFKTKKGAQNASRKMKERLEEVLNSPTYAGLELELTGPRKPNFTLWVGNIRDFMALEPYSTAFLELFRYFGGVHRLKMMPERNCAFVEYENTEHAKCARNHLHGAVFGPLGREVHLNVDFSAGELGPNQQRHYPPSRDCRFCNPSLMAAFQESLMSSLPSSAAIGTPDGTTSPHCSLIDTIKNNSTVPLQLKTTSSGKFIDPSQGQEETEITRRESSFVRPPPSKAISNGASSFESRKLCEGSTYAPSDTFGDRQTVRGDKQSTKLNLDSSTVQYSSCSRQQSCSTGRKLNKSADSVRNFEISYERNSAAADGEVQSSSKTKKLAISGFKDDPRREFGGFNRCRSRSSREGRSSSRGFWDSFSRSDSRSSSLCRRLSHSRVYHSSRHRSVSSEHRKRARCYADKYGGERRSDDRNGADTSNSYFRHRSGSSHGSFSKKQNFQQESMRTLGRSNSFDSRRLGRRSSQSSWSLSSSRSSKRRRKRRSRPPRGRPRYDSHFPPRPKISYHENSCRQSSLKKDTNLLKQATTSTQLEETYYKDHNAKEHSLQVKLADLKKEKLQHQEETAGPLDESGKNFPKFQDDTPEPISNTANYSSAIRKEVTHEMITHSRIGVETKSPKERFQCSNVNEKYPQLNHQSSSSNSVKTDAFAPSHSPRGSNKRRSLSIDSDLKLLCRDASYGTAPKRLCIKSQTEITSLAAVDDSTPKEKSLESADFSLRASLGKGTESVSELTSVSRWTNEEVTSEETPRKRKNEAKDTEHFVKPPESIKKESLKSEFKRTGRGTHSQEESENKPGHNRIKIAPEQDLAPKSKQPVSMDEDIPSIPPLTRKRKRREQSLQSPPSKRTRTPKTSTWNRVEKQESTKPETKKETTTVPTKRPTTSAASATLTSSVSSVAVRRRRAMQEQSQMETKAAKLLSTSPSSECSNLQKNKPSEKSRVPSKNKSRSSRTIESLPMAENVQSAFQSAKNDETYRAKESPTQRSKYDDASTMNCAKSINQEVSSQEGHGRSPSLSSQFLEDPQAAESTIVNISPPVMAKAIQLSSSSGVTTSSPLTPPTRNWKPFQNVTTMCELYKQSNKLCMLKVDYERGNVTAEVPPVMDVSTRTTAAKLQLRVAKRPDAFTVWRLSPSTEADRAAYLSFCEYFKSRDRIGLLETPTLTVFIVPLDPSSQELSTFCQVTVGDQTIVAFVSPKTHRISKPLAQLVEIKTDT